MKTLHKLLFLSSLTLMNARSFGQDVTTNPYTANNKGKIFIYWGGNRGFYSKSDIHFKGDDFDFTVNDATAHDKPKGWHIDYINPTKMTIPQTNLRVGYFITDNYSVSIGVDHMKYVMTQNQQSTVTGTYPNQGTYGEVLQNGKTKLTEDFLMFEHTDGLNYVNAEIARHKDFSKYLGIINTDKIQFNGLVGVGAGVLYPKTNATVLGRERYDDFKVAGWGVSAKAGVNATFLKHFFIQYEWKFGYIDIVKAPIILNTDAYASHHFTFNEGIFAVGGIFKL